MQKQLIGFKNHLTAKVFTRKNLIIVLSLMLIFCLCATPVFADTDTSSVDSVISESFGTLYNLFVAVVRYIGAIFLLWGFFDVGISLQSHDGVQQAGVFKKIGGGALAVLSPSIVSLLISI